MAEERQYTERGGVQRTDRGKSRTDPYANFSRADNSQNWAKDKTRDLFHQTSSYDKPQLAPSLVARFGQTSPQRTNKPTTPTKAGSTSHSQLPERRPALLDRMEAPTLLSRLGLKETAKAITQKKRKASRPGAGPSEGIKGRAEEQRQQTQPDPARPVGVLVTVANLVSGTTSEDVKAAFSEFGDILNCVVGPMPGTNLFAAQVRFKSMDQAQVARQALNGVLADGQQLLVTIEPETTVWGAGLRQRMERDTNPNAVAGRLGYPNGSSNSNKSPSARAAGVVSGPSKMRSDEVMRNDPRSSVMTDPADLQRSTSRRNQNRPYRKRSGGGGNSMEID